MSKGKEMMKEKISGYEIRQTVDEGEITDVEISDIVVEGKVHISDNVKVHISDNAKVQIM